MASTEALLARVEKLLALATSGNVHEAAAAASRAQALIEEHRLDALLAARAEAGDAIGEETLEVARRPRAWRAVLAEGLARRNGGLSYAVRVGADTELRVVGRAPDRAAVRSLFGWLAPRIEWLSATHGAGRSRAWHEAFRVGAASEVVARVAPPPAEQAGAGLALLRADHAARAAAVERWAAAHLRLGAGRGRALDARGYRQGRAAAEQLDLPAAPDAAPRPDRLRHPRTEP